MAAWWLLKGDGAPAHHGIAWRPTCMSRIKRALVWTGAGLAALVSILLFVVAILNWTTGARLQRRIKALRAAGQPVCLADLTREPIPAQQDAAALLGRIEDDVQSIQKELRVLYEDDQAYTADAPTDAQIQLIRSTLSAYPEVLPTIELASRCPDYVSPCDFSLPPGPFAEGLMKRVNLLRGVARTVQYAGVVQLADGQRVDSLNRSIQLFRLTRHFDREPTMVSYLVSLACRSIALNMANRCLQDGPLPQSARSALETELARHDSMEGFLWMLRSERPFGLDNFQALSTGWMALGGAYWKRAELQYLDWFDRQVEVGATSAFKTPGYVTQPSVSLSSLNPLVRNVIPAFNAVRGAMNRVRAQLRCLRVLNALQALEPQPEDSAVDLTRLALPGNATIDPYTGEPLHVKRVKAGWIVYSVFDDRVDDGGNIKQHKDVGVGANNTVPTDVRRGHGGTHGRTSRTGRSSGSAPE